jgi:trans-aconitate methyltransferase
MAVNAYERAALKASAHSAIDAASQQLARGEIAEEEWQRRVSAALATAYLRDDDPRWQSGFDGDPQLWREARELVLDAVPANGGGSLLDVGCANGHLMESLATWARDRGLDLSIYGLEIDSDLAETARRRLPEYADRIFTGNASDWIPPRRFDYVRTGLEYAPPGHEAPLIARLLREVVATGGRLIVGPISESSRTETIAAFTNAGVSEPGATAAIDHNGKTRYVLWASPLAS